MAACHSCGAESPAAASFCPLCGAPLAAGAPAPPSARKTVTVLFCDVAGSTGLGEQLDPESLRRVMGSWYEEMRAVLERHGGTVEKFIGDAVMAVFGVPRVHEDDALRAVRAAVEMGRAVAALNRQLPAGPGVELQIRIGVNTGEVVAGDPSAGQTFVTGDPVNVAKRLESAAEPGEILIGSQTRRLIENAVVTRPRGPLELKGKSAPLEAWSVVSVSEDAPAFARRLDTPLVGRERELDLLEAELERATAERTCRLVTIFGPAGIGKSRLAAELAARTGDAALLTARCLPYGDGATFWPLAQLLRGAGERLICEAVAGEPDAELVRSRLLGALGEGDDSVSTEETFWAFRRLLEGLARRRPLILRLEDIHWAQPTFLDLIEYLVGWTRDAPILVLCLARPELLDGRPDWPNGGGALTLEPLSAGESDSLIERLCEAVPVPGAARARILEAAEGNPLFVEQMVAMLADDPERRTMPPTIQALLAARLDRLEPHERGALERASVLGRDFTRGGVAALSAADVRAGLGRRLLGLVRKELIQPDAAAARDDDGFRFRHALIRDAAYAGLPKESRADLHERAAAWHEAQGAEDEIVGYHLERAHGFRVELGQRDEAVQALAARAGGLLARAARRAYARADMPAARSLLERALALLPEQAAGRIELRRELAHALWETGDVERALDGLDEVAAAAAREGDRSEEWYARLDAASMRCVAGDAGALEELVAAAAQAVEVFADLGDDLGLAQAWRRISRAERTRCRYAAAQTAAERALGHARAAGDGQEVSRAADVICTTLLWGPTPTVEAIPRCKRMLEDAAANRYLAGNVLTALGGLHAMHEEFADARALCAEAEEIYRDLGLRMAIAGLTQISAQVELLAGEPEAAERELRRGLDILERPVLQGLHCALLAAALWAQERHDEAADASALARDASAEGDILGQVLWRSVLAKVHVHRGGAPGALALAAEAAELAGRTDALNMHAEALVDQAHVLAAAGREREAERALRDAHELYERKGNRAATATTVRLLGRVAI